MATWISREGRRIDKWGRPAVSTDEQLRRAGFRLTTTERGTCWVAPPGWGEGSGLVKKKERKRLEFADLAKRGRKIRSQARV